VSERDDELLNPVTATVNESGDITETMIEVEIASMIETGRRNRAMDTTILR
jgi:hypothetical protein